MGAAKHIGIVLHSAEGAMLCYKAAIHEGITRMGAHNHPKITMSGRAMHHALPLWENGDLGALRTLFQEDIRGLALAGADFFVLPDNTAHIALETEGAPFDLPGLHIAEVVADDAKRQGFRNVGILGTRWTMEGPVYPEAFGRRGIDWAVPDTQMRERLHAIIFDELCLGIFEPRSVALFEQAIADLAAKGCDAAALVCTEIPLIISDENSALPILDSTRLLAKAAVDAALNGRDFPAWTGGPL